MNVSRLGRDRPLQPEQEKGLGVATSTPFSGTPQHTLLTDMPVSAAAQRRMAARNPALRYEDASREVTSPVSGNAHDIPISMAMAGKRRWTPADVRNEYAKLGEQGERSMPDAEAAKRYADALNEMEEENPGSTSPDAKEFAGLKQVAAKAATTAVTATENASNAAIERKGLAPLARVGHLLDQIDGVLSTAASLMKRALGGLVAPA